MIVYNNTKTLQNKLFELHLTNKKIGFVPTMGALHQGHLSLIKEAKSENDIVVCSIFVNPLQFNNPEDLQKYPRTLEKDIELLQQEDCDILYTPEHQEIYHQETILSIDFGHLATTMEGAYRPGHFSGVGIIVAKLFNIVQPSKAYFGQKDLQQYAIIHSLQQDLSFPIELKRCPIVREPNGLAMSSRNERLSSKGRAEAQIIFQKLNNIKEQIISNQPIASIREELSKETNLSPNIKLEYIEICHAEKLTKIENYIPNQTAICIACYIEDIRLIDNIIF